MRVLWLCNIVLPDYADEFGIKKNNFGGWMTGMLNALESKQECDIALCFPIIDKCRLRNGKKNGHQYYSFQCDFEADDYGESGVRMTRRFEEILKDFMPDVIHIWGTEYIHTYAMVKAAEKNGCLGRVVIHIQGLVCACGEYYLKDIPSEYVTMKVNGYKTLEREKQRFINLGRWEKESLLKVNYVMGRTDWDKACVCRINPNVKYFHCGEILKIDFYKSDKWKINKEKKTTNIFMTQGAYPIKGIHYVIEAISSLIKKNLCVEVKIAGSNILENEVLSPYACFVKMLLTKYDLNSHIHYIGQKNSDEMIDLIKSSDIFLLSSMIENSPNSLCEAMMIGVPVVASAVGGIPSIIRNNREGITYKFDDPHMMAWKIQKLIENVKYQEELSKNEKIRAMEYNSIEKNLEDLKNIYEIIQYRAK